MALTRSFSKVNRSEIFENRPEQTKISTFPVKFPINREFAPVTGSLKTASITTKSFEFIGKGIESERPKLSSGFRAMMQSFLSKTPNSMHYSARSPQKFLLRLLKWDLEAGYWCTILFRFEHSPPLSLQKTANERGGEVPSYQRFIGLWGAWDQWSSASWFGCCDCVLRRWTPASCSHPPQLEMS